MTPPSLTRNREKPSVRERFIEGFKRFLPHRRFKSTSQKAGTSTPTHDVYRPDVEITLRPSEDRYPAHSRPRASPNDLPTDGQTTDRSMLNPSFRIEAGSLCIPGYRPDDTVTIEDASDPPLPVESAPPATAALNPPGAREQRPLPSIMKETAELAWHGIKLAAKNAEPFLDGTPLKIPIAVFNKLIETADAIIDNKESMAQLLLPIRQRLAIVKEELTQKHLPEDIEPSCTRFASTLELATEGLETMHKKGLLNRILELDEHQKEITRIFGRVDEATKNFQLEVRMANFRQTNAVKDDTEVIRLNGLRPSQDVRYATLQRESCIEGTREEIIKDIISWCKDPTPGTPAVYWLSGMAGTGKSTIAYTICEQLADDGRASRLAASFFCSRQIEAGRQRRNIIPTLAHELALELPRFRRALLDSRVDANLPPLKRHLDTLLLAPWDASIGDRVGLPPLVVVVDALDEVENDDGSYFLQELLQKIGRHRNHLQGLKFFVTSRRDARIVEVGESLPSRAVYRLEEVPPAIANHDITIYLRTSLPQLGHDELRPLTEQASGLFIYAATAVRFIIPPSQRTPSISVQRDRLQALLNAWPDESRRGPDGLLVDHLYEEILSAYLLRIAKVDRKMAVSVLHIVLCAEEPILISDIAELLNEPDKPEIGAQDVTNVILALHSVLYVSADRVYSYHKSFVDFLFDPTRFDNRKLAMICCPTPAIQARFATSCFRLMNSLRFNICGLPSSFLRDTEIEDLATRVQNSIPSPLQYACRHWAAHLSKIPIEDRTMRENVAAVLQQWFDGRLLFWMETMNLLKMMGECYPQLMAARRWLGKDITPQEMQNSLAAESLASVFGNSIIAEATPHLYLSALASSSRESALMTRWRDRFPRIATIVAILDATPELLTIQHGSAVSSVGFSPDGLRVISGSKNTGWIWDVSTGRPLRLDGHDLKVTSVAFSPDGLRAISGSEDHTVCIWDVATGRELHRMGQHEDGQQLHRLDQYKSGRQLHRLRQDEDRQQVQWQDEHKDTVTSVTFSPDGLRAISGSEDNTIRIWEVSTGRQLHRLDEHEGPVTSVGFSPDGSRAISGSEDNTVRIWEVKTGRQLHRLDHHEGGPQLHRLDQYTGGRQLHRLGRDEDGQRLDWRDEHEGTVTSVGFSPDGSHFICGSSDKSVLIWEVSTGRQLHRLDEHEGPVTSVGFSPDGSRAISGSEDNTVRIWELSTGRQLHRLDEHEDGVTSVAFSRDGSRAISGSSDETLRIWEVPTRRPDADIKQLRLNDAHEGQVMSVKFLQDGLRAITSSLDKTVRIWEVTTGKQLDKLTLDRSEVAASFSLDGLHIISDGHNVSSVSFSPDGSRAISGSYTAVIRIWDLSTKRQLRRLDGHQNKITSVGFSPNGLRAISGSSDKTVRIWDVSTGRPLWLLDAHKGSVNSVAFSPDGSRAISGSEDTTVRIWEVSTGRQLRRLNGHTDKVNSVAFSPDGLHAISGSTDKTVRIWNVAKRRQIHQLDGHEREVTSVGFSPDGLRAISGSRDTTVRIWTLPQRGLKHPWQAEANGWITSNNERCLWLPPHMRRCLYSPQCLIISPRGSVKVNLANACRGTEWHKCYDPNVL
ncbi:quinon protein alcohol dehydrogenase-like superfamily [Mycena epipterygia]|nr:quinon protein alcohol dehydrogenase-like superfamily [Mycena epipterygia]